MGPGGASRASCVPRAGSGGSSESSGNDKVNSCGLHTATPRECGRVPAAKMWQGEPSLGADVGQGGPAPGAHVAGVGTVIWQARAQVMAQMCSCDRSPKTAVGPLSPGADVQGRAPVPVRMWQGCRAESRRRRGRAHVGRSMPSGSGRSPSLSIATWYDCADRSPGRSKMSACCNQARHVATKARRRDVICCTRHAVHVPIRR